MKYPPGYSQGWDIIPTIGPLIPPPVELDPPDLLPGSWADMDISQYQGFL